MRWSRFSAQWAVGHLWYLVDAAGGKLLAGKCISAGALAPRLAVAVCGHLASLHHTTWFSNPSVCLPSSALQTHYPVQRLGTARSKPVWLLELLLQLQLHLLSLSTQVRGVCLSNGRDARQTAGLSPIPLAAKHC